MNFTARQFRTRCGRTLPILTVLLLPWAAVRGDESGTGFWLSGAYSSFAAVAPQTGFSMPVQLYYYNGNAGAGQTFQHGISLAEGINAQAALMFLTPTWAPAGEKWFGGQPSFALTLGGGWEKSSASLTVSTADATRTFGVTDTIWGGMDLYPQAQIAWNKGNNNWMSYITGDIPTGAYQSNRLANIGLGHTAVDVGGAYTYFNTKTGTEASAVLGFTYNGMNTHTNIQSGWDSHLDFSVSQFLSNHLQVGIVGYVYYQLTGDSGTGNRVGAFKSRVASGGPAVGYAFTAFGQPAYLNLRGYWEFWAQNRLEGRAAYLTLSIPLYPRSKNTP
jgi:hypothetical protein